MSKRKTPDRTPYVKLTTWDKRYALQDQKSWVELKTCPVDLQLVRDGPIFNELWNLHPSQRASFTSKTGQVYEGHRWQKNYGADYEFAGEEHKGEQIDHPFLSKALAYLQELTGKKLNNMVVNWYEDGKDDIGFHCDKARHLMRNSPVACLKLGLPRKVRIKRHSRYPSEKIEFTTPHNSIYIMGGNMQNQSNGYLHCVPPETKLKGRHISITARLFEEEEEEEVEESSPIHKKAKK